MECFRVEANRAVSAGNRGNNARGLEQFPISGGSIGFRAFPAKDSSTLRMRVLMAVFRHRNAPASHQLNGPVKPGSRQRQVDAPLQTVDERLRNSASPE